MSGPNQDKMKEYCSLSPDVMPFIPKQHSIATEDKRSLLSVHVAEFVPSWLKSESVSSQQQSSNEPNRDCAIAGAKQSSMKKKSNFKKSEKNTSKSIDQQGKSPACARSDRIKSDRILDRAENDDRNSQEIWRADFRQEDSVDSDFPALVTMVEQGNSRTAEQDQPVAKSPNFLMSFSEKLKSSNRTNETNNSRDASKVPGHIDAHTTVDNSGKYDRSTEGNSIKAKNKNISKGKTDGNSSWIGSVKNIKKRETEQITGGRNFLQDSVDEDANEFHVVKNETEKIAQEKTESFGERNKRKSGKSGTPRDRKEPPRAAWEEVKSQSNAKEKQRGIYERSTSKSSYGKDRIVDTEKASKIKFKKEGRDERGRLLERNQDNRTQLGQFITQNEPEKHLSKSKATNSALDRRQGKTCEKSKSVKVELEVKITFGVGDVENAQPSVVKPNVPMSYSDILKSKPKLQLPEPEAVGQNEKNILKLPDRENEELEQCQGESKTKKKKKKKKKKESTNETPQAVKKTKQPLVFDFGEMFEKLEGKSSKKKVIRAGGFLPAQAPLPPKESKITSRTKAPISNTLDSTAPIVLHGKERETPKRKKPSAMRKILTKEREQRKLLKEGKSVPEQMSDDDGTVEDDHVDDESDTEQPPSPVIEEIKKSIHSRKFREYCDQELDYDINGLVITLLKELIRFQDRLYHKDPVKAKARRRFVCGLREVSKHVKLKRLKCVIVTPNMEPTKSRGGLDDLLSNIIDQCHSQNVPVVFSLNRQILGKVLLKKVPVSIVGIFYYDGAQNYFKNLMERTKVARETYKDKFECAREKFLLEKEQKRFDDEIIKAQEGTTEQTRGSEQTNETKTEELTTSSGEDDANEVRTSLAFADNVESNEGDGVINLEDPMDKTGEVDLDAEVVLNTETVYVSTEFVKKVNIEADRSSSDLATKHIFANCSETDDTSVDFR